MKIISRKYVFTSIIILLAALIVLISSSCCIDLSKFSKSGGKSITFGENQEQADKNDLGTQSESRKVDYSIIKKELSEASDYRISKEEEEIFFSSLEKIYPEEKYILVRDYLDKYKILYPCGYYTLLKVTQEPDINGGGYGWFIITNSTKEYYSVEEIEEEMKKLLEEDANDSTEDVQDFDGSISVPDFYEEYGSDLKMILHELTHGGSRAFGFLFVDDLKDRSWETHYSYMIGNLLIFMEKEKMFFSKYEIFSDIKNPDHNDKLYHDPNKTFVIEGEEHKPGDIDFSAILDEINAYTVSAKHDIATEEFMPLKNSCNTRYGLLKQLSYLELYLKRCNEKYPEDWQYLTEHKGMAFLIMKLWYESLKIEAVIKDDPRFSKDSGPVAEFVYDPSNYGIIEMFFKESEILEHKNKDFKDIDAEFDNITVYDINDS